jgi:AcrR family transcriptional regulator
VAGNGSTQDSILREAGRLFALKGFHGTSTREIAEAVGIRQPSLFHHFASKHDIADALFAYDHSRSYVLRGQPELPDATPPVRLYQTVRREVLVELTSEYDLRGLYLTALIEEPEFARWQKAVTQALEFMRYQIDEGTRTGDFMEGDHNVVVEILDAVLNQVVRRAGRVPGTARPDDLAAAVLRLVLKRPSRIPGIRREADRLLAKSGVNWPDELAILGEAHHSSGTDPGCG